MGAKNISRRLETGRQEARLLTELERNGIAVFVLRRYRALLASFSDTQLRDLVHGLWRKGWLDRIEPGKYVVVPRAARRGWSEHPFVVAEGIAPGDADEHYVSYWSALSHHDLTEQLPRVVYVATLGLKKPPLVYKGWRYRFVPLATPKFYGSAHEEFVALNGAARVEVQVALPEKAVVDSLDHAHLAGGIAEVAKAIRRGLDGQRLSVPRLVDYAARFPNAAVPARLGYLLELHGVPSDTTEPLQRAVRRRGPPPLLEARGPREGAALDRRWYLQINVASEALDVGDLDDVDVGDAGTSADSPRLARHDADTAAEVTGAGASRRAQKVAAP